MNKYILLILLFFPAYLHAQIQHADTLEMTEKPHDDIIQELQKEGDNGGQVVLTSDKSIDDLLAWHVRLNEKKKMFAGYRIQIYSVSSYGCNVEKLKEMRNKFEETFQHIPAYLKYFDPDFKIRVGNYRNRLECIPDLHRIRKVYPASYAVKTEIFLEELQRVPMQDLQPEQPEQPGPMPQE